MRYEKINILITFEPQKEKQTPTFSSANHKVRKSQPNLPSRCTLVSIFEKILTFHFYSLFPRTAFIIKEWLKTRVKVKSCNCLSTFFYSLFTCASERYFNCFLFLLTVQRITFVRGWTSCKSVCCMLSVFKSTFFIHSYILLFFYLSGLSKRPWANWQMVQLINQFFENEK